MARRLAGAFGAALLLLSIAALPAAAVEATEGAAQEEGPAPTIDEIGTQNEVSREFFPEEAEEPPFFRFFYGPLIAVGVLMSFGLLVAYLLWQPRFAEERRSKRRRR